MGQAFAIALAAYGRVFRQMGRPVSAEELSEMLRGRILPHQNRGSELAMQVQSVFALGNTVCIRSQKKKRRLADS